MIWFVFSALWVTPYAAQDPATALLKDAVVQIQVGSGKSVEKKTECVCALKTHELSKSLC